MGTSGKIAILLIFCATLIGASAAASPDILIHPDTDPIIVGVSPNPVDPPLDVEYTDWGSNVATYSVSVFRVSDGYVPSGCAIGGTIPSNNFHADMTSCIIPASDVGVAYKVVADAKCPSCAPYGRSRVLIVDANIDPIPELNTTILTSAGLFGLIGMVMLRRKE